MPVHNTHDFANKNINLELSSTEVVSPSFSYITVAAIGPPWYMSLSMYLLFALDHEFLEDGT